MGKMVVSPKLSSKKVAVMEQDHEELEGQDELLLVPNFHQGLHQQRIGHHSRMLSLAKSFGLRARSC